MRKLIPIILTVIFGVTSALNVNAAALFKNETLKYVVTYKWGLIHKDAGDATVTLRRNGDQYRMVLTAKSKPWADKIYRVRDTLESVMRVADLKPISYVKRMHEKDKNDIDRIKFTHSGNTTKGAVTRHRVRKGKASTTETTLTGTGPVYDFLSIFYYLRKLDYSKLNQNKVYAATVFSGSKKRL